VNFKICSACGNIERITGGDNYFNFFGMEVSPVIDQARIEALFYELSRKFHPDFFTGKESGLRLRSLELMSYLNDAYRTLKERTERLKYILKLYGIREENNGNPADMTEFFEINEALEEAASGGVVSRETSSRIGERIDRLAKDIEDGMEKIGKEWKSADAKGRERIAVSIAAILGKARFVENLNRAQARISESCSGTGLEKDK